MSVPQSERRQSDVEYLTILQNLEVDFINRLESDKETHKTIMKEIVRLSIEAYNYATLLYEISLGKVMGSIGEQKKYCKKTYWTMREIASQLTVYTNIRMREGKSVKFIILKTQDLLKACNLVQDQLRKLNKEENKNQKGE